MEKIIKNRGGFAIIEIVISLALVSFALMTIVAVFPKMTAHRKVIKEVDVANIIAAQELERIQLYSREFPVSSVPRQFSSPYDFDGDDEVTPTPTVDGTTYDVTYDILPEENKVFPVEVTVKWTKSGKSHEVKLTGAIK